VLGETPHTVRLAVEAKLNRAKQSKQYRDQALKLQGIIQNLDKAVRAGKHSSVVVAEAMIAHGDMRTEKADGFAYIQVGQAARWLAFSRI
jgi:polyphosphate kinase 2 (PPK2 family)